MVIKATGAASNEYAAARKAEQNGAENKNGKVINGSVFGGNLKQKLDPVSAKKAQAQKKAMKMWSDAAGAQQKIDKDLEQRASNIENLRKEINELNNSISQISDQQEALKEQYGITEADAQDLELLKKANSMDQVHLTEEEKAKAEQLKGQRVGEYYERYAGLESGKDIFIKDMENKQKELLAESKAITAIQNGRLKDHSMIDTQKKKDEMMIAASKDAAFGMMNEVKDKIDERQEELEEKEKEKAEEKKEEEERLEAIRDKSKENKDDEEEVWDIADTDEILQLGDATKGIKQDVKKMVNEMNLLVEDLKGAAVDKGL
ncbi:MAG: hypothetical protein K2K54_05910 [Lachnospiraceae bacterium]|nr:hypothetical protein [Lachnospiraceae bacterium]